MAQTSLPTEKPSETVVEKSDPWFDDGNVVFACEGAARFRFYAGLMSRHSEVFRNLFADAAAHTASSSPISLEGCPVVELTDSVEDCQNLLLALCEPVTFRSRNIDDFLYLSSLLIMATKYCIDWLRHKAIACLNRSWPHTIEGWLNARIDRKLHPALVVNLARRADVPIVLPLALYRLGSYSIMEAFHPKLNSSKGPIPSSTYILSPEDQRNHAKYQERRLHAIQSFVRSFLDGFEPDGSCRDHATGSLNCRAAFKRIASAVRLRFFNAAYAPISFMKLAQRCADEVGGEDLIFCSPCKRRLLDDTDGRIHALWEELPSWFDLPEWKVLTADLIPEEEL